MGIVEIAIALHLLDSLAGAYEAILMTSIPLVGGTLLSLGRGGSARHATGARTDPRASREGQP